MSDTRVTSQFRTIDPLPGRLFVIGDIHGCAAELEVMIEHLFNEQQLAPEDTVVFVGDYLDRGEDSRAVVSLLIALRDRHPNSVFLKGNHEDMLLAFLGFSGSMGEVYLQNGGAKTLESYGIEQNLRGSDVASRLPAEHLTFFLNLERFVVTPRCIVVHAGLSPLRSIEEQSDDDLFWIRNEFIQNIHRFDKPVLFGHTPYADILLNLPYKIGVDTGLVYGNKLSCIEMVTNTVLQVGRGERTVRSRDIAKIG